MTLSMKVFKTDSIQWYLNEGNTKYTQVIQSSNTKYPICVFSIIYSLLLHNARSIYCIFHI